MSLTIQGSFEAYAWAVLWQVALGGMQAGGDPFNSPSAAGHWMVRLQFAISMMSSAVSWVAWGLSVWVSIREGVAAGILFGVLSFTAYLLTVIELHRVKTRTATTQIASLVAMPLFALQTLNSLGVLT